MKKIPTYTTVIHTVRLNLGLSMNEYCIADSICKLSNSPEFPWCLVHREDLGAFIGISKQSTITIIHELVKKGLVEVDEVSRKVRASQKWIDEVVLSSDRLPGKETLPEKEGSGKASLPGEVKQLVPSIYIRDKNKEKMTSSFSPLVSTKGEINEEGELTREGIDEDGNSTAPRKKPAKGFRPSDQIKKVRAEFSRLCKKVIGISPVEDVRGYQIVAFALGKGGLSEVQIFDLFDEWFKLGNSDEDTISITRALSARQIESYKVRNNVTK